MAVAVSILEQSAALDAIRVFYAIQAIVAGKVHRPLQCHIHPVGSLVFHTSTHRQVDTHLCLTGLTGSNAQTYIYIRCKPFGSPVFLSCAVGPEVVFISQTHIQNVVLEGIVLLDIGIIALLILRRAFQRAVAHIHGQRLTRVELVFSQQREHRLHILHQVGVEITQICQ